MYQLNTKPHSLFEKRGFDNLSMASPLLKGFKLVVNLLTMYYSLFVHMRLTHKKVKSMFHCLQTQFSDMK